MLPQAPHLPGAIGIPFKRLPDGLGPLLPVEADGKRRLENPPDDAEFGRGKIGDFTWKGMLLPPAECGRAGKCPARIFRQPLSPKLVIMDCVITGWPRRPTYLARRPPSRSGARPGDSP